MFRIAPNASLNGGPKNPMKSTSVSDVSDVSLLADEGRRTSDAVNGGGPVCAHCGRPGDLVEVFFSNRPMVRLHRACKGGYRHVIASAGTEPDDIPDDRTCAQCHGEIDGTERLVSVSGHSAWLHLECERFWVRALKERER